MPIDTYEDDEEEQEGPRSSFGTYLAEGDALFKQSEYKKALESYSLALELQPNDKICLVARSKCYLKLGDPQKALQDAEDALAEDKEFNKGLYRKAEALYCMGDFEYALMYYHRGHKLRPELDEFRLGIQKAQEAIDNSIGSAAKIKLENKGDLSFFTKQDDMVNKKQRAGYLKPVTNAKKLKALANRNKEVKTPAPSKKTVKQLLGELYSDKEYFEKLMEDETFIKSPQNGQIYELVQGGLNYLDTRTEFWRQQKPLYARKKDKPKFNPAKKTTQSISKYILKQLQEVDQALSYGNADRSLRLAQKLLKSVEGISKEDLPNKSDVIANIHSCVGNAYIELEQLPKALRHHEKDLQMSKVSKSNDGISRSLDNIGRVHARMGNFKKAVSSWTEKLPLVKTSIESTWLCHEIGRCYLELGSYIKALEFGQKSLAAAKDCEDQIWQLNATVLIAQSHVKLGNIDDAVETFSSGLEVAVILEDLSAQSAISKALGELQRRSSLVSGRNTANSEREGSPHIQSDPDDRSGGSSRAQSPLAVEDEEKVEVVHEDDQEDEGNETSNEDNDNSEIINVSDTCADKPTGDEVLEINPAKEEVSPQESDIHVNISSATDDNAEDISIPSSKGDIASENDNAVEGLNEEKPSKSDENVSNNLNVDTADGKVSFVDSDMPLTSGDLDRQSSAEKLESVDSISAENVTSQDNSITNNVSKDDLDIAEMDENVTSSGDGDKDLTSSVTNTATEDASLAEASHDESSEKTTIDQEVSENEKPPTPDDSAILTSQIVSTENITTSNSVSNDNEIPTDENVTTSENVTSTRQSSENVESLVESTESAPSIEEASTYRRDEASESHKDESVLSESSEVSARSAENTSADVTSEALASAVQEPTDTVTDDGTAASELETVQDISQASKVDDLPLDSSKETDVTSTEATEQEAGTTEATEQEAGTSDDKTDGMTDGDAGFTEKISQMASQETIDSTTDEIPLDSSQTSVNSNSDELTTNQVTEDSSKNTTDETSDVSKTSNDENISNTDTAPRGTPDKTTSDADKVVSS